VDGSIFSQSVCHHAAWVAQRTGWAVELLHVLGRREGAEMADYSGSIALGARTALLEELAELDAQRARLVSHRGRAILEHARAILDRAGIDEITTRLRHGGIVDTVAAQEAGAEMILIGKRGEAADSAKGHLGSNLERIVRASRKPVFVASRAFRPIARMLIAYDGGASAMRAVEHVARTPLYRDLHITIVTVGNPTDAARKQLADAPGRAARNRGFGRHRYRRRTARNSPGQAGRCGALRHGGDGRLRPFAHPHPYHWLHHDRDDPLLQGADRTGQVIA
jgi:nucleotide-binding universal stress UspA family protein